jgi:hypothetical protein
MAKSRWEEYKEKNKKTVVDVVSEIASTFLEQDSINRLNICNSCDHLIKLTKECKKDKTFILETIKIKEQKCPIGAW